MGSSINEQKVERDFMEKRDFFLRALELAEKAKGATSPNPAVGCVIEKNGRIISEGATQQAGCDHAEIVAIKKAASSVKGSTMYVTLEPCVDFCGKKTPSCSMAIIKAGIKKVVIGMKDLNPLVNGRGIEMLKNAGIEVEIFDEFYDRVFELNEDFFKFITTGFPFVYVKVAMTLDGNIATLSGDSKWISGEESRKFVHSLRNRVDSILVGINTVLKDNPTLNVRLVDRKKDPLRIIVDPYGKTTENYSVMTDNLRTLFIVSPNVSLEFINMCRKYGKDIIYINTDEAGNISFKDILYKLGEMKITSVLVEGGSRVFYRIFKEGLVDKIFIFLAPKLLLGKGIPFMNGDGISKISDAVKIKNLSVENIGEDILVKGYLKTYGNAI